MPILTDHLRDEISVLERALERLATASAQIEKGAAPDIEDLRMVVFAIRILFKRNLILKLETVLFPALTHALASSNERYLFDEAAEVSSNFQARVQLMRLQLALDSCDDRLGRPDNLAQCIVECLEGIRRVVSLTLNLILPLAERWLTEEDQERLYFQAHGIDLRQSGERQQATRLLNRRAILGASGA